MERRRRTKQEIEGFKAVIYAVCQEQQPMTVRQMFYQLASVHQVIGKTEADYKATGTWLTKMRLEGELPFHWLADNTRWVRRPDSYGSLSDLLAESAKTYRRALWSESSEYVEVWLEKDALSGVIYDVTSKYDAPLMVTRGYPSVSFLHSAAKKIAAESRPTTIYYFGDYDPTGVDISRNCEARLREFAPDAELSFERVAVNEWQIDRWKLPTRPTKASDKRSTRFADTRSVELDAIPPDRLRSIVRHCLRLHISDEQIEALRQTEELERQTLFHLANHMEVA